LKGLFVSTAPISQEHGGGNVSYHELAALHKVCNDVTVIDVSYFTEILKVYGNVPFMSDYYAASTIQGDYDLVVSNGNPWGLLMSKLKYKAWVADVPAHDLDESIKEFQLHGVEYPYVHMTNPVLQEMMLRHIRHADSIICPSQYSASYLRHGFGITGRIDVIPHGTIIPPNVPPLPDMFIVGHLGQNGYDKGQTYLMQALHKTQVPAIIAGDGTEAWGGWGRIQDKNDVYRMCSVYVQPSVTDGFAIPVLEALAHGRPVICSLGAGAHELIKDGYNGYTFKPRDVDMLSELILKLKSSPQVLSEMSVHARDCVEPYSWDKIERRYEEVYKDVLT
jgi:glycosyltransferase involved in cell wall biosynthesis